MPNEPVYQLVEDDLSGPQVAALLRLHLDEMHSWSPPESVHAMPIERLRAADVTFYSAWDEDRLAACGAIKQLDAHHGELKSMRADPAYRGKGAGKAILGHLLQVARDRGLYPGQPGNRQAGHVPAGPQTVRKPRLHPLPGLWGLC